MTTSKDRREQLLQQFRHLSKEPLETARSFEEGTKGVVACAGMYFPEELIHAAGFLPIVLLEQNEPVSAANAHVQSFMCGYVRSMMDQILENKLKFLKALIIKDCCHEIRMIGDLNRWTQSDKVNIEFSFFPVTIRAAASQEYITDEIGRIRKVLGELAGAPVTDEAILNSIRVYNENRLHMQRLYALRRANPGIISSLDVRDIVRAGMSMPKDKHSALVAELAETLEQDLASGELKARSGRTLILSGSLCESIEVPVLKAIEEADGLVVDDDLYVGSRYFNTLVREDLAPTEALTDAYVNRKGPCATQFDDDNRLGDYLREMADNANAKGIITIVIKFCEAHYFGNMADLNDLRSWHGKTYSLFTDHDVEGEGQIQTRIQSFLENL